MRIAVLPLSYLPSIGGAEFVVHNAALEHERAGHSISVFPNLASRPVWRHLPYTCIPVWRRAWSTAIADGASENGGTHPRRLLRWRLAMLQRIFRADVWHIHAAYPVGWAVIDILRGELGVPVVVTSHGSDIYDYSGAVDGTGEQFDPDLSSRIARTLHAADALIAVGPKVEQSYRDFGIPEDKVSVIPHGWHPDRVDHAAQTAKQTRQRLGVTTPRVALAVAADRPEKRLDDLLDAADHLEGSPWTLVVSTVGSRLGREVQDRGLGNRVVVREESPLTAADLQGGLPRQATLDLYAAADVMILPSVVEASPTVFHEAFAAGCPVITTTTAASGVVDHLHNGLVIDGRDPEGIAAALARLDEDTTLLAQLRSGAAEAGKAVPHWKDIAAQTREVYEAAIAAHATAMTSSNR